MLLRIEQSGIIAVIRRIPFDLIERLTEALIESGISVIEVTFGSERTTDAIECLAKKYGNDVLVGAGTVLDVIAAKQAIESGADFLLSPGLNNAKEIIHLAHEYKKITIPGAMTPSEIIEAFELGADAVKVFPASVVGAGFLQQIHGPIPNAKLIPTGGININNVVEFFKAGAFAVGVGGNLVNDDVMKVKEVAKAYRERIEQTRLSLS